MARDKGQLIMKISQSLKDEQFNISDIGTFEREIEVTGFLWHCQYDENNNNSLHNVEALPGQLLEMNILIVDDDVDSLELLVLIFADTGANITCAVSASEALAILGQYQPSLIISDIGMPDTDGYTLIQQIRAMPSKAKIPAIALTAYDANEDRDKALAVGFQEFITKPIDPDKLINQVIKFCH
jgi:CheY-like chemotaxis protein